MFVKTRNGVFVFHVSVSLPDRLPGLDSVSLVLARPRNSSNYALEISDPPEIQSESPDDLPPEVKIVCVVNCHGFASASSTILLAGYCANCQEEEVHGYVWDVRIPVESPAREWLERVRASNAFHSPTFGIGTTTMSILRTDEEWLIILTGGHSFIHSFTFSLMTFSISLQVTMVYQVTMIKFDYSGKVELVLLLTMLTSPQYFGNTYIISLQWSVIAF